MFILRLCGKCVRAAVSSVHICYNSLSNLITVSPMVKIKNLEHLVLSNNNKQSDNMLKESIWPELTSSGYKISIETLLDCLIVLYDECQNSSLRREKTVSEFIELSECHS